MKDPVTRAHIIIFNAVEGAVRNTAHGHPEWKITRVMACSIAKRATGTLANLPVLAPLVSEKAALVSTQEWPPSQLQLRTIGVARTPSAGNVVDGRRQGSRRLPLSKLWKRYSNLIGEAKRAGNQERAEAFIEAIRLLDKTRRGFK